MDYFHRVASSPLAEEQMLGLETAGIMLNSNSELRALTGLRGFAALTVALAHYNLPLFGSFNKLFFWHASAVDLFFCLSGFTLALVYIGTPMSSRAFWNYAIARFARIYPLYIASLIAMMFIRVPIGNGYDFDTASYDFVLQVLMVNAWPIGSGVHWNIPAWSISVEWFCYIFVMPPLWVVGTRLSDAYLMALAAACMMVTFVALNFYYDWNISAAGFYNPLHHPSWTAYVVNVVRGLAGFIAGWAVFAVYTGGSRLNQVAARATDTIVVILLVLIIASAFGVANNIFIVLFFPTLLLGLANEGSTTARILASPLVHRLGLWSYSIYMLHAPMRDLLDVLSADTFLARNDVLYAVTVVSGLLASAAASYHFFEVPWRRMLRIVFQVPRSSFPTFWSAKSISNWLALAISVCLLGATLSWSIEIYKPVKTGRELLTYVGYIRFLRGGWSSFESTNQNVHVWGIGHLSTIKIDIPVNGGSKAIELKGVAFVPLVKPKLLTHVVVDGETVATIEATHEDPAFDVSFNIARGMTSAWVQLVTEQTASPMEAGLSDDDRQLSISLTSLRVVDVN